MKILQNPDRTSWPDLIRRPQMDLAELNAAVGRILEEIRTAGDAALKNLTRRFDGVDLNSLEVSAEERAFARSQVSPGLQAAMKLAADNIRSFHQSQFREEAPVETMPGVKCWRKAVPVEKVGLYIPGGTAPLFSTVLMLAIPAQIAGCREIVLCTPPGEQGQIHPAILYAAEMVGVTRIFKVGGAQAIAALTFGTESIPAVDKIFGPGNQYVTKAKELAQNFGVAIDMPAGPSELLVIADATTNPGFVAADLLSQAEHGADSQVVFCTDEMGFLEAVRREVARQVELLPRKATALQALSNSLLLCFPNLDTCLDFSNLYAPEHLIVSTRKDEKLAAGILNAGSVFLGPFTCESAGDYASGTNHTLPTGRFARNYSGVSLDSFFKQITFQQISREGIRQIGPAIEVMAEVEELIGHKNAVSIRLKFLDNGSAE